ncbi:MAG: CapA family protein [Thermoleophilia bacterium]|nr:CapA family protein [Thermoleophilia bacterium]
MLLVRKPARTLALAAAWLAALAAACGPDAPASRDGPETTARLLFAGDVMLGRGVATAAPAAELFAGIELQVAAADVAIANLESPLTARPHDPAAGPNALEAGPESAGVLAVAGFDALALANNHAGDAGPATVTDTLAALAGAGLGAVGGGLGQEAAFAPLVVDAGGLRIALLAFDATGQGPRAGPRAPGIAWWDDELVRAAVARARAASDIVAVGLHGGAEYVKATDPYLLRLATSLAGLGVDVVWGHGPHVVQPIAVIDPDGDGRPTVVATSLGNLLFDQHVPGTREGALLEVLAGSEGVRAFRVGQVEHEEGPVRFRAWLPPRADAVALGRAWWSLAGPVEPVAREPAPALDSFPGDVLDAAVGDPNGDGQPDVTVAFRRPYAPTAVGALVPRGQLVDEHGRSAHVGLYRPGDLRPRWVAGTLLRPVAALAPCDGTLAVAYSQLDDPAVDAGGAWRWGGFGFLPLPDLPGSGRPACADVDGDGKLDPLVLERSP